MRLKATSRQSGFTLLAVMLITTVLTILFVLSLGYSTQKNQQAQIDRVTIQMQEILNAGVVYYLRTGSWPVTDPTTLNSSSVLETPNAYVPANTVSPWGPYYLGISTAQNYFTVSLILPTSVVNPALLAQTIAGRLPMSLTCIAISSSTAPCSTPAACTAGSNCEITAQVSPPGMDLSHAESANFTGIYHSGACVPAPACPPGTSASIYVIPVSVSGTNDAPTCTGNSGNNAANCTFTAYPLTSYTAYNSPLTTITQQQVCTTIPGTPGTPAIQGTTYPAHADCSSIQAGTWDCFTDYDFTSLGCSPPTSEISHTMFGNIPYYQYTCPDDINIENGGCIGCVAGTPGTPPTQSCKMDYNYPAACTNDTIVTGGVAQSLRNPPCLTTIASGAGTLSAYSNWTPTAQTITSGSYWRVCLQVNTQKGLVTVNQANTNGVAWGQGEGSVLAITRCVPTLENSGSDFSVYQ